MKLLIATLSFIVLTQVDSLRITVQIEESSMLQYKYRHFTKRQAATNACNDYQEVERRDLTLPGGLNDLDNRVKFFRSAYAEMELNNIQDTMQVIDIDANVRTVFNKLREGGCLPFFMGGSVRDQFLGKTINDVDIQVDCTIDQFLQICQTEWMLDKTCGRIPNIPRPLGYIGTMVMNRNIDLGPTALTFYSDISFLDYTANDLAYDTNGNTVIIDLTGKGVGDACSKIIRIPSDDDSQASWNTWRINTGGSSLYRFWKLRTIMFNAFNDATSQYIIEHAKSKITTDTSSFPTFYCETVYHVTYTESTKTCLADSATCLVNSGTAQQYKSKFSEDLGDFWMNQVVPKYLPGCPDPSDGNSSIIFSASYPTFFFTIMLAILSILSLL